MIEFAPGYRQVKVNHLTRNYFPLVTPEPTPESYMDGARRNPRNDPSLMREQQIRREAFAFFALSELAVLMAASFGKPHEVQRAQRAMQNRKLLRGVTAVGRLPYTTASIPL